MESAQEFFAPAAKEAQAIMSKGANVYLYSFDYVAEGFPWKTEYRGRCDTSLVDRSCIILLHSGYLLTKQFIADFYL